MFGLSITNLIALSALVVAIYGAILSTILYLKERLSLKIFYLDENYFYFSKKDEVLSNVGIFFVNSYYNDVFSFAVKIRICNNSKSPTTINSFTLNKSFHIDKSSIIDTLIPISFCNSDGYITYNSCKEVDSLKPLITLNPYTSIEGYLIFNNLNELPSKLKIKINTVQKTKSFNLKIKINDCRKLTR